MKLKFWEISVIFNTNQMNIKLIMKLINLLLNSPKNMSLMELNMMENSKSTTLLPMELKLLFLSSLMLPVMKKDPLTSGKNYPHKIGKLHQIKKYFYLLDLDFMKLLVLVLLTKISENHSITIKDLKVFPLVLKELIDLLWKKLFKFLKSS